MEPPARARLSAYREISQRVAGRSTKRAPSACGVIIIGPCAGCSTIFCAGSCSSRRSRSRCTSAGSIFERIDGWLGLAGVRDSASSSRSSSSRSSGSSARTSSRAAWSRSSSRRVGRLPFVRLLYTSTKDLLNAFVGEKRRFDKPVLVRVSTQTEARMVGFVTQESLDRLGLPGLFVGVLSAVVQLRREPRRVPVLGTRSRSMPRARMSWRSSCRAA